MKTYVAQRLAIAVLTLVGMSLVIFALLRLAPGDIVDILFSSAGYVNAAEKQAPVKLVYAAMLGATGRLIMADRSPEVVNEAYLAALAAIGA